MKYRYRSRRSAKRLASKSKRNFVFTLILIGILIYATFTWVLPYFIGGLGFVKNIISPPKKTVTEASKNANLAPPVLNIPYEATNSSEINIKGFGIANSKVKIFIDDNEKTTTDVSSDGSFATENISLSLGLNNIYGITIDEDGKESLPSKTIRIIYDDEKPSLSLNEPEDNKKIQGGDKKVKVSGKTEPGSKVFINNAQIIADREGNFNIDQPLNEGDNDILIKAVDIALNSTEMQRKVIYTP